MAPQTKTLTDKYLQAIDEHGMLDDSAQLKVVTQLESLSEELCRPSLAQTIRSRFPALIEFCAFSRLFRLDCLNQPVTGIYLWGGVGRGKTWLIHLFYENLPFQQKQRLHFHAFMQSVHEQLATMKKQKNPLKIIARNYARQYRVLCLDEFIVTNITDAMLLSGLLESLFQYGVTLIATSNRIPDDLYLNGLQRERFLPAIDLIKLHTHVIELDNGIDHRLALLENAHLYNTPLNQQSQQRMHQDFTAISLQEHEQAATLTIFNRSITTIARSDDIVWFDFTEICSAPRAAQDYVEIAQQFHTVFLSNIPVMDESHDDKARRFIYLIDALYDSNVKLFISAASTPEDLYHGTMLEFAFNRTCSRLIEMRSEHYLSRSHKLQETDTSTLPAKHKIIMPYSSLAPHVTEKIESLCGLGCQRVNEILSEAQQNPDIAELNDFSSSEKQQILHALSDIMSVYELKSDE